MKTPVQVPITIKEAEKVVRMMGSLGRTTTTTETGPEANSYRFRNARNIEASFFVEIDYRRQMASVTLDAG